MLESMSATDTGPRTAAGELAAEYGTLKRGCGLCDRSGRGIECIVKCQIVVNGQPTAWCAQHDEVTLEPRLGRSYEHPSISGGESSGVLLLLIVLLPFAPRAYRNLQYTRMRKDPQRAPKHVASFWYTRMVKFMEAKGIHKGPHQTPSEFAAAIHDPLIRKEIALFTDHYQRARFDESTHDAQLLPGLYQALAGKR